MELREHLRRSGGWLFRWRSYLPLLLLMPLLLSLRGFHYPEGSHALDRAWEGVCFAVSLQGLLIRVLTVGFAPPGTSGRSTTQPYAALLNRTGAYSLVRHPLYVGNYFLWLGVMMLSRTWWLPVFMTLAFWLYYERIAFAEEEVLREKFGLEFTRWAAVTPVVIPVWRNWRPPQNSFSFRAILRRERSGVLGLVVAFTLVDFLEESWANGHLAVDPVWLATSVLTATAFLGLRTAQRRSTGRRG